MDPSSSELTRLIADARQGGREATDRLLAVVYKELRALAQSYFAQQRGNHTLQPTALVHEAYLRLVRNAAIEWDGRSHFFAVAARAMRNVLADHARSRRAAKRGGDWGEVALTGYGSDGSDRIFDALDVDEALQELAQLNERHAQIVELRFFGGMTVAEAANVLEISERTAAGEWQLARAWLRRALESGD